MKRIHIITSPHQINISYATWLRSRASRVAAGRLKNKEYIY